MWKISTKIWVAVGMSLMLAMGSSAILLTRLHYTAINYDCVVENNTATKDAARSGHAGQVYGQFPARIADVRAASGKLETAVDDRSGFGDAYADSCVDRGWRWRLVLPGRP